MLRPQDLFPDRQRPHVKKARRPSGVTATAEPDLTMAPTPTGNQYYKRRLWSRKPPRFTPSPLADNKVSVQTPASVPRSIHRPRSASRQRLKHGGYWKLTRWQVSPSEMRSATLWLAIAAEPQEQLDIIRHSRSSCVDRLKFASIAHWGAEGFRRLMDQRSSGNGVKRTFAVPQHDEDHQGFCFLSRRRPSGTNDRGPAVSHDRGRTGNSSQCSVFESSTRRTIAW